jgi:thiol:disulfide interchange protein
MINRRFLLPFFRLAARGIVASNRIGMRTQINKHSTWNVIKSHPISLVIAKSRNRSITIKEIFKAANFSDFHQEPTQFDIDNEDEFDEVVLHSEKPILVQFYADWLVI